MKKLFILAAFVLGAVSLNAQDVGQMWVGGSLGFSTSKVKDADRQTSYKILPEFGYVVNENFGVGINVGFAHTEGRFANLYPNANLVAAEEDGIIVAPFLRYTLLKGDIGGMFLDGGVNYYYAKDKGNDLKTNIFEVGIRPGVAISISDCLSLTGKFGFIGYTNTNADVLDVLSGSGSKTKFKENAFDLNFDMNQFLFGINFVF